MEVYLKSNKAIIIKLLSVISTLILVVIVTACKQNEKTTEINVAEIISDTETVNVFYFHGKQRCETCSTVSNVAQQTVETAYTNNNKVRFIDIDFSEKANEALTEKYEVMWNSLIIAKGDNVVDITPQAFAVAVKSPQLLENLIKEEVNNRLTE